LDKKVIDGQVFRENFREGEEGETEYCGYSIEECSKMKRELMGEERGRGVEGQKEEIFKRSNKLIRSQWGRK